MARIPLGGGGGPAAVPIARAQIREGREARRGAEEQTELGRRARREEFLTNIVEERRKTAEMARQADLNRKNQLLLESFRATTQSELQKDRLEAADRRLGAQLESTVARDLYAELIRAETARLDRTGRRDVAAGKAAGERARLAIKEEIRYNPEKGVFEAIPTEELPPRARRKAEAEISAEKRKVTAEKRAVEKHEAEMKKPEITPYQQQRLRRDDIGKIDSHINEHQGMIKSLTSQADNLSIRLADPFTGASTEFTNYAQSRLRSIRDEIRARRDKARTLADMKSALEVGIDRVPGWLTGRSDAHVKKMLDRLIEVKSGAAPYSEVVRTRIEAEGYTVDQLIQLIKAVIKNRADITQEEGGVTVMRPPGVEPTSGLGGWLGW